MDTNNIVMGYKNISNDIIDELTNYENKDFSENFKNKVTSIVNSYKKVILNDPDIIDIIRDIEDLRDHISYFCADDFMMDTSFEEIVGNNPILQDKYDQYSDYLKMGYTIVVYKVSEGSSDGCGAKTRIEDKIDYLESLSDKEKNMVMIDSEL